MKKGIVKLKLIKLEEDSCHLFVNMLVNGVKARMLLDTGASKTVFDLNSIDKFIKNKKGLKQGSKSVGFGTDSQETSIARIKEIKLAGYKYDKMLVGVVDMSHIIQMYNTLKLKPMHGVLGSDLLLRAKAIINYEKMQLSVQ
jgi:hypothetical protein